MLERRQSRRGRTYLGGKVAFDNRFCTMDCIVRNLSQNGAMLVFPGPVMVPAVFDIQIHNQGESRRARIIWRTETEIGISLVAQSHSAVISIEAARRIKQLEADRDALERRVAALSEPM